MQNGVSTPNALPLLRVVTIGLFLGTGQTMGDGWV